MGKGLEEETSIDLIGGNVDTHPLQTELRFYEMHLPEWKSEEGQYILVYGDQHYGFYEDRNDATREGLRQFGRVPFLIKKVLLAEKPRVRRNAIY